MCGICGIVRIRPGAAVPGDDARLMADALVHRGPDDDSVYADRAGRCALGFRRLSIIDLAGGRQPISNETGDVWVLLNGEIYNFRELRAELQQCGHRFATGGDAEVIAHLYEDAGAGCFERLAGMFAIAIWDERSGRLLLARDRFGKKPLVYAEHDGRLLFASELKAIAAIGDVPRVVDIESLHHYLVFQYIPAPRSIYAGFRKLPPGCFLEIEADQAAPREPRRYYQLDPAPAARARRATAEPPPELKLDALLHQAVARRLIADVPLGAFLSGGVDSSIVVALMRELGVSPLRTFSIGFEDARYDESPFARSVARRFQTEHHEHVVTPQAREVLSVLTHHYDEPFADSSAIPTYYVSRFARQSVTVALTGDGGDECFGGYDRYRALQLAARFDVLPRGARRGLAALAQLLPHRRSRTFGRRLHRFAQTLGDAGPRRYLEWMSVFHPDALAAGYLPGMAARANPDAALAWFEGLFAEAPPPAANRAIWTDIHSYLPGDLLTKVDIASMACSLECRSPLLDHELVEFALALPLHVKLGGGGKRILKRWARGRVPDAVLDRPKMGFGVPIGAWLRRELKDLTQALLDPQAACARVFNAAWLRRLINDHLEERADHEHRLWALLMLDLWDKRWRPTWPM